MIKLRFVFYCYLIYFLFLIKNYKLLLNMELCFICCNQLNNQYVYLPMYDEYFGQDISIFKNTFIIISSLSHITM